MMKNDICITEFHQSVFLEIGQEGRDILHCVLQDPRNCRMVELVTLYVSFHNETKQNESHLCYFVIWGAKVTVVGLFANF